MEGRSDYAYRNASLHVEELRPCPVFIDGLISRNFRDEAPIARDLFMSASRRAFARRGSSAYRMKRAPKLQLKLSVSIRAHVPGRREILREKVNGLFKDI